MKRMELISVRKKLSMTQAEVANKAGMQRSYYGLIETGKRNPSLYIATKIAIALGVTINDIFPNEVFFADKCYSMKPEQP